MGFSHVRNIFSAGTLSHTISLPEREAYAVAPAMTATVRAKGAPYQRPGPGGAPRAHLLPPCLLRAPDSSGGGAGGTPQGQEGLLLWAPSRGSFSGHHPFSGLLLGAPSRGRHCPSPRPTLLPASVSHGGAVLNFRVWQRVHPLWWRKAFRRGDTDHRAKS